MDETRDPGDALRTARVYTLRQADMLRCRFAIMAPSHYRPDGSCRCDDPAHRRLMIRDWGYRARDFTGIPLRKGEGQGS